MSKKKKELTEIVAILDASGSMSNLEKDTKGGYDAFIREQKSIEGEANVTLVVFSDNVREVYSSKPLVEVEELTKKEYSIGGMTALYDAIGLTITKLSNRIEQLEKSKRPNKVIMLVTTDGEENSSKEYNHHNVKELVEKKQKEGWEIIFIGANIDVEKTAGTLGFARSASYDASSGGTQTLYSSMSKAVGSLRMSGSIDENWDSELKKK